MSEQGNSVLFVCLGNICRSPLAEGVFRHQVEQAGLAEAFHIDSCGTSSYHVGEAPDPGSRRVAAKHGVNIHSQRSRQLDPSDFERFDLLICMDQSNVRATRRVGGLRAERGGEPDPPSSVLAPRLHLLRQWDPVSEGDVPDPWGGGAGGFDRVFEIVDRSCRGLLEHLRQGAGL